jgi:predicted DNA-binding transcriptional regulator YafY
MSDSARLYAYKALFEAKRLVTRADMMEVAEVSLATFKRDIAKLRDQMGMPILFDKDRGGYYLGSQQSVDRNARACGSTRKNWLHSSRFSV